MRFPGFEGEWQEKCFGEIAPLQRGFDLPTQNIKKGNIPIVYSNGILNYHNESKCKAPGLITGRSGTIGRFTFIESGEYWPHNTALWVTDFCNNYPYFIYYLYQTANIDRLSTGSGVPTLNRNDVHRKISYIPSIIEQKKITDFLSLLDDRISTQMKIIEKLESLIKGVAHSLIKNGKANIQIKDCLNCFSSTLMESMIPENNDGKYPVYGAIGVIGYMNENTINTDAILIIKDGASVGRVQYAEGKYSVTGTLNYLTPKDKTSLKYMYYCLQLFNFDKYKVGSGIPHIYFKDYGHEYIYRPSFEKQKEIASVLSTIDEKLGIERKVLEKYAEQKEHLLCNLFI